LKWGSSLGWPLYRLEEDGPLGCIMIRSAGGRKAGARDVAEHALTNGGPNPREDVGWDFLDYSVVGVGQTGDHTAG